MELNLSQKFYNMAFNLTWKVFIFFDSNRIIPMFFTKTLSV